MRRSKKNTLAVVCACLLSFVLSAGAARAQQAARIDTVSPSPAAQGQVVTITGIGFGSRNVRITVGDIAADVISATGSRVTFVVPYGLTCGPTEITATNPGGHTGRIAFVVCGAANVPPTVNAGSDLTVYLPSNATLNGTVSDDGFPAGSVLTTLWSEVSGPGTVTFSNPASPSTTASFSEAGLYVLRLTASDTEFTTGDETSLTVYPANHPPTVNAGPDLVVYLPATAALTGTVGDDGLPPGSALTMHWSKVSGPGTVTFSNPASANTTAAFSVDGAYVLRLTANDTEFTIGDEISITVHPANQPLAVNAGPDLTVYLPAPATLNGSVIDDGLPPGSVVTMQWSKVGGPGTVTFGSPGSASTTAVFSAAGSYVLRLTANDTEFTISDETTITVYPANQAPTVNAGPDVEVYLPAPTTLNGSVIDDGLPPGSVLTLQWSKVSGPGTVTFGNPASATTAAAFTEAGAYVVRLTATDTEFTTGDETTITVHPANEPPTVDAGPDLTVYLPGNATLNGTISDDGLPPGSMLTVQWSKVSGPGTVTFSNPSNANCTASFSQAGAYVLRLTANDTEFTIDDETSIAVYPANQPPAVNAGPDLTVYLPAPGTLNGSVVDDGFPPGSVLAVQWSKVSGPGTVTFSSPNHASTTASFSEAGSYVLRLTASDTEFTIGDETTVAVQPANQPPGVNAGPDLEVYLPANATVNGAVSDDGFPPGSVLTVQWSKVSGPGTVTFGNPASATTTAAFSEAGAYVLRLSASDTEFTIGDETAITVHPANQAPVVIAGPDLDVYLPATATLDGAVTDDGLPPGSALTIQWSKVSGPGTVTFSSAASAKTTAAFSEAGSYVLRLTASDTEFTLGDETTITVHPANQAPVVDAGPGLAIRLPNTAQIAGAATDDGLPQGSTLTIQWSKASGPGTVTFSAPNAASTAASFSEAGQYVLRLTASDSEFTTSDETTVDATAANRAPIANAGADVSLGVTKTAHLDGGASVDPDGDPLTFAWVFVSAPAGSAATLAAPATATPSFVIDRPGTYVVRLVVNDGALDSAPDIVSVTTENTPPVANAGPDQTAPVAATITLDATGSSDVDGDALTYEWTVQSAPAGSTVVLSDGSALHPTFVIDQPGGYVLQLVVRDGVTASESDTVVVSTVNSAPVANAGPDQTAPVTQTATLNGGASSDVDGDPLTFFWVLVSAPNDSTVVLANPTAVMPTFVVDRPGTYVAQLVVHDGTAASAPDTVTVTTVNSAPVANAGADQSTLVNQMVALDGSGSTDVDGDPLTHAWSLVSVPAGSTATLSDPSAVAPTFVADRPGTYVAQLIVSEPNAVSTPDTVTITTRNSAPVANAGPDQTVVAGHVALLNGAGSSDVDGDPLTFQWSLTSAPPGSSAVLANPTSAGPSFIVDRPGMFVVQLIVNDGTSSSAPDTVAIDTTNSVPVANAGPDQLNGRVGTGVALDASQSSDADGHTLTYSWSLTAKPAGSAAVLSDPAAIGPVFTPDIAGDYVAQLIVNDGFSDSTPDAVLVRAVTTPTVSVTASDAAAAEAGPDTGTYSFTRTGGTTSDLVVHVSVGGNAIGGVDYVSIPQTITIGAGQTSALVIVTPIADAEVEGPETVVVTLDPDPAYGLGLQTSATVTIAGEQVPATTLSLVGSPVVGVGKDVQLQILLGQPAPPGGVVAAISSDDTGKLTVGPPATAAIAAGATLGFVTLHGITRGSTIVRSTATGFSDATLDVVVSNNTIAAPITLNVPLGQVTDFPISITREPANNGPVVITVVSDNPSAVVVNTPTVTIPAGGLSANAVIFGQAAGLATLTSTAPNFATDTSAVTTTAHLEILNVGPTATMTSGFARPITIQLESPPGTPIAAPAGGVSVAVVAANPACVAMPPGIIVAQGTTTVVASLAYGGTAPLPCTTTVTVGGPAGVSGDSVSMTVNPAPAISLSPSPVGGGLETGYQNGFLGDANHGGVTVHIVSGDPGRVVLAADPTSTGAAAADISVANGQTSFVYYVQGIDWVDGASSAAAVTLTASATGFANGTTTISYVRPVLEIINLPPTTTSLSANTDFGVRIGVPTASNTMQLVQARRFGAPPLVVTASNSDAAVAEIDHNGGIDGQQTQTSTIAAGEALTPNNAAGGFEFDPIGVGSTTVTASIPNFTTLPAGIRTVAVTGQAIFMPASLSLGGGLQHGSLQGGLGAPNHGGVSVHIASGDPSHVKIAANATSPGADAIDVPVPNGTTVFAFYVQGADWVSGTSTTAAVPITASATGFTDGMFSVSYVQPVLDMINLAPSTTSLSASTDFVVRVGVPNPSGALLQNLQARRFGAPSLVVTVSNSNAAVAEIDHNGGIDGAQTQTSSIAAGQTITPNNNAGGFEFDPFGVGTTIVTASIPDFITLPAGVQTVTVTGAGISMPVTSMIGGGLQNGPFQGNLGASNHGGVTVHLQSSDPSRMLIAPNGTSPGAASLDIPLANGSTLFQYFLQGVDWVDGVSSAQAVTITATATGFSPGPGTMNYVRPVLDVINLPSTTTALSANTDFMVRIGVPTASNTMQSLQARRFGGAPLVVTAANSNAGIAELDQNGGLNGAQVQTSSILEGQSTTPSNAAGGFEFDPFGTGTTAVTASIPNFLSLPAATVTVTVSTPAVSLPILENIGGGLMYGPYQGGLGGSQHGGVQVHLVSSDPSRVLLGTTTSSTGAAEIDVPVPNGQTFFLFYVIGTDWVDGVSATATVTVTATASGFSSDGAPITYVKPTMDIANLATDLSAASPNRDFNVRIGVPNATNTALRLLQWRRPGASDLVVTVANSNAAVAEIDGNGGVNGAQVQTVTIAAGQSSTPFNAAGGLEFDPLGAGSTVLIVTIPGFAMLPAAGFTVIVIQ